MDPEGRASATLPEDVRLTNHIGSQHAGALFTLAETAASAAAAAAFGDTLAHLRPLVTGAEISYVAIARGKIHAEAVLDIPASELVAQLQATRRARFDTTVRLTDENSTSVASMTVHWYVSMPPTDDA